MYFTCVIFNLKWLFLFLYGDRNQSKWLPLSNSKFPKYSITDYNKIQQGSSIYPNDVNIRILSIQLQSVHNPLRTKLPTGSPPLPHNSLYLFIRSHPNLQWARSIRCNDVILLKNCFIFFIQIYRLNLSFSNMYSVGFRNPLLFSR